MFEIIPQAPRYEMNARGVLRNRETGRILKWFLSPKGIKTTSLAYAGKKITVTLPHLMWQLHGKIISKKRPVPVVISKGTRSLRFDSLRQCSRYLANYHGLKEASCRTSLARRYKSVGGWHIHTVIRSENMVQKILLTIEIDDTELDKAQQKADKLIATLERAQALMQGQTTQRSS